jgi:hypothetical protein
MVSSRRRRCAICHHGFTEDPRIGKRQKVCGRPECQKARRQQTQASWRHRHPGYFIERRAKKRAELNVSEAVDPPRVPPPLSQLPWEMAQEEFGTMGADFLASFGRIVVGHAKDQMLAQVAEISTERPKVGKAPAKDQILAQAFESAGQSQEVGVGVPKDQRLAVPG